MTIGWLDFPSHNRISTLAVSRAGTPFNCLWKIVLLSLVEFPLDRIVVTLLTDTLIQLILASHIELSTSMIICTNSPGMYPSFSKCSSAEDGPLDRQQQLVIYPLEVLCCAEISLVSLKVIS